MGKNIKIETSKSLLTKSFIIVGVLSVCGLISATLSLYNARKAQLRSNAVSISELVISFRSWVSNTGVIWVNKLHKGYKDYLGEEVCSDVLRYYSKNPALATRELSKIYSEAKTGTSFKVTSDNYRHEANKPDRFEADALKQLRRSNLEFVEGFENDMYRYSVPLIVSKTCLKCHGDVEDAPFDVINKYGNKRGFGYKEGDIRGIITVNIPINSIFSMVKQLFDIYNIMVILTGVTLYFLMFNRLISSRIRRLNVIDKILNNMASGDLSFTLDDKSNDEVARISFSLNSVANSLSNLIGRMIKTSVELLDTSYRLKLMMARADEDVKMQAEQIDVIAKSIDNMANMVSDISNKATYASEKSTIATNTASQANNISNEALLKVESMNNAANDLAQLVDEVTKNVSEIGGIVSIIKDIADQTNLLALNASIEASRAGEHGKGFSVVAEEVKKLAEKIIDATMKISRKIESVQEQAEKTSIAMSKTSEEVSKTDEFVRQIGELLIGIVKEGKDVSEQVLQIAKSVEEHSEETNLVAYKIEESSDAATATKKMVYEVLKESFTLVTKIDEIRQHTLMFKSHDKLLILDMAKGDHRLWINKIAAHLEGFVTLDVNKLSNHTTCALGRWYETEGRQHYSNLKAYKDMAIPHKKIHQLGKDIVTLYNKNDLDKAYEMFSEMEKVSNQIIKLLDEIKEQAYTIS